MKRAIIICTLVSVLWLLGGLALLSPARGAQQRFYRVSNQLERVAEGNGTDAERRQAATEERLAIESLYMLHATGRGCLWMAALFSSAVFVIAIVEKQRKLPIQPPEPMPLKRHGSS